MPINLLKLLHHFARSEFRFDSKHASLMADQVRLIQWPNTSVSPPFARVATAPSRWNSAAPSTTPRNRRCLALDRVIAAEPIVGITETVPTYRSLLVRYDPVQIGFDALGEQLRARAAKAPPT